MSDTDHRGANATPLANHRGANATPLADPVLGTQLIAKILQVSPRTVSKLVDSGQLPGHCIPLSKTRRVLRSALVQFCREANLPPAMIAAAEAAQRETHGRPRKPRKEAPCPDSAT